MSNKNSSPIDVDFANIFFKPIAHYLSNPETAEVMVNAPDDVWVEDNHGLRKVPETFTADGLASAVNSLAQYVGRPLIENIFSVDARMPDGSRVCIVLPPVSGNYPAIAIRKFKEIVSDLNYLVGKNTLTTEMIRLIDGLVRIKKNMMVAGGTSSGKTTLLNLIAAQIPDEDRIITIEDSRELQLKQEHVLSLEAKPADKHGKGEFSIRQCLKSTLRLRPDRIVVGEIRGGEAFDLIQAMNTGHGGCMGTVHANTPADTLKRIESLALIADVEIPLVAVRSMISSALDVIISPARLSDGSRRIIQISEVGPLTEKGEYQTFDIVRYVASQRNKETGKIEGYFEFTGHVPSFFPLFAAEGVDMPVEFFRKRVTGDVPEALIPKLLDQGYEIEGHAKKAVPAKPAEEAKPIEIHPEPIVEPPKAVAPPIIVPVIEEPVMELKQPESQTEWNNDFIENAHSLPAQTEAGVEEEESVVTPVSYSPKHQSYHAEIDPGEFSEQVQPSLTDLQFARQSSIHEENSPSESDESSFELQPQDEYAPAAGFEEETFSEEISQPETAEFSFPEEAEEEAQPPQAEQTFAPAQPSMNAPVEAPKRPSLLEKLSRLSNAAASQAAAPIPEPSFDAEPEQMPSSNLAEESADDYQLASSHFSMEEPVAEQANHEEFSYEAVSENQGFIEEEAEPEETKTTNNAFARLDDYPTPPIEPPSFASSSTPTSMEDSKPSPDEQSGESKPQHMVIAEILKRMRENRSSDNK